MKRTILIGVEFIIFILLLCAVIIYSQVLIKKVIDTSVSDVQLQPVEQELQQVKIVGSSTNDTVFSSEEKYTWLLQQESLGTTTTETSGSDKRAYLTQMATSSDTVKPLTVEEKMKFLE